MNSEKLANAIGKAIKKQVQEFLQQGREHQYDVADVVEIVQPILADVFSDIRTEERQLAINEIRKVKDFLTNVTFEYRSKYNPDFGDNKICVCNHVYYRHFDSYENMSAVGCKYCECRNFKTIKKGVVYHIATYNYDLNPSQVTCYWDTSVQSVMEKTGCGEHEVFLLPIIYCIFCTPEGLTKEDNV